VRRKRGGEWEECEPSRFLFELPAEDVRWTGEDIALDPGQPRERGQAHIAHLRGLLSS
jgi:ATP-dependent DNA helicase Rep